MKHKDKKRILVISLSDISKDPRVYRQLERLRGHYEVHAAGKVASGIEERFFSLGPENQNRGLGHRGVIRIRRRVYDFCRRIVLGLDRVFGIPVLKEWILLRNPSYTAFVKASATMSFDLIIVNDLSSLSLAMKVRGRAKLLYDAHEYSAGQSADPWWLKIEKPFVDYLLNKYIRKIDAMTTVCEGIAEWYARDFNIPKPAVVMNAPIYQDLSPQIREDNRIRIVHHGIASRARAIELMVKAVGLLDERYSLDLYLVAGDETYYEELRELAAKSGRIRLLPPVGMLELPVRLNDYDIGVYMLPPTSPNQLYALPNKIFEFVQARLAVAIGPSPEMARIVKDHCLGVVAYDFTPEAMARAIEGISHEDLREYKLNAHKAARDLSAEPQMKTLEAVVGSLASENGQSDVGEIKGQHAFE